MKPHYHFSTYEEHVSFLETIIVEDGKMAYLDVGEGPAILLIHGVPNSSWLYRKMVQPLVEGGFRVIVPDMLGYGVSEKPADEDVYTNQKQGDRILTLMAELGIHQWVHVCHDAGGPWTWEMIRKEPARVNHLVILNTILYKEGFHPPFRKQHGSLFVRLFSSLYSSKLLTPLVMRSFWAVNCKNVRLTSVEKNGYIQPLLNNGNHALRYFFSDFFQIEKDLPKMHEILKYWSKPVTVIWGTLDKTLNQAEQIPLLRQDLRKVIPTIHILQECSHMIQEEAPQLISIQIIRAVSDGISK